jgi:hypothetical protein
MLAAVAADTRVRDVAAGALGVVALLLGVVAGLGVLRPPATGTPGSTPVVAAVGVVVGLVGLYVGPTRGLGRRVAVVGTGIALLGLAIWGGAAAIDLLLDASADA